MTSMPAPSRNGVAIDTHATIAVLCVESRPDIQACVHDMVMRTFAPTRVTIVPAGSIKDAVVAIRTICFDLVISAYRIDEAEGGVLEHLRKERFDLDRFVFFTGAGEDARAMHPKTIDKGIRVERFIQELRRLTRQQLPWPARSDE